METPASPSAARIKWRMRPLVAAGADFIAVSAGVWNHRRVPARRWGVQCRDTKGLAERG